MFFASTPEAGRLDSESGLRDFRFGWMAQGA